MNCSARLSPIYSLSLLSARLWSALNCTALKWQVLQVEVVTTSLLVTLYESLSINMLPCLHTCCKINCLHYLCRKGAKKICLLCKRKKLNFLDCVKVYAYSMSGASHKECSLNMGIAQSGWTSPSILGRWGVRRVDLGVRRQKLSGK